MILNRIKQLRKEKKLTQVGLGKELNIHPVTLLRYEKGESVPSKKMAIIIANFFGVDASYLLGISDRKNETKLIKISNDEYVYLKEIEQKYNEIKALVID